ncbi:hypothetical protein AMAG_06785 [Allomyces macrogynus ATCC 38327]|uniref:Major facilitator superfamily (MFS) profile domain-containing protein n=1 Tax=Allomyces macrogynus (strain ATCC 38327) TaxID=578462 RepID=A0A0L0SEV2_ALLM3|nr:hypothetical protein AMAG_06785 [Allomyces macrogynus ATCC 38327]|eukprot:KNE61026.1 hypothetical protein AMAG_06785 [Allomyces macrogynus ATCC 38327]
MDELDPASTAVPSGPANDGPVHRRRTALQLLRAGLARVGTHFNDTARRPVDPAALKREQTLFLGYGPRFNRYQMLPAAFLLQLFLGTILSWSVFNAPISSRFGSTEEVVSMTFFLSLCCLGFSAFAVGPALERHGPRTPAFVGCALFALGNIISGISCLVKSVPLLYVGSGIVGGVGSGMAYLSLITALQKNFHDKLGLSAGVAVSGFGCGAVLGSFLFTALINATGLPATFFIFAATAFAVQMVCAIVLRFPPPGAAPVALRITPVHAADEDAKAQLVVDAVDADDESEPCSPVHSSRDDFVHEAPMVGSPRSHHSVIAEPLHTDHHELVKLAAAVDGASILKLPAPKRSVYVEYAATVRYLLLYYLFFSNLMGGLVLIPKTADLLRSVMHVASPTFPPTVIAINGLTHIVGSLAFGRISDRVGRLPLFAVAELCQMLALGLMMHAFHSGSVPMFCAGIWILQGAYGAGLTMIPGCVTDMFGSRNIGPLYGLILTAWSCACLVAGFVSNAVVKARKAHAVPSADLWDPNFYWMQANAGAGCLVALTLCWMQWARKRREAERARDEVAMV